MAAISYEKVIVSIPQLTNERDWLVWKFQVQHVLKASGQWEFVTGDANQEAEGYESKKQKAFYLIIQCVGQRFMAMVMGSQTPKDMWDILCRYFESRPGSNKVCTLMHLYGLHMKRGTWVQEHLHRLEEFCDYLAAIGEVVSDVHKVAVLLQSVYPTLVTALLARGGNELTLMFVKEMEEQHLF